MLGDDQRRLLRGHLVEENNELIATNPGGHVACSQRGLKAGRQIDEHSITGGVTQGVVHGLEAVDIEEQHREARSTPASECHSVG